MNNRITNTAILISLLVCVSACGGGGGGGGGDEGGLLSGVTSKFLEELGSPGSGGPTNIKLETVSRDLSVVRDSSISFDVTAEVSNQGDYSQGLTISAECPIGSTCEVSPSHFSRGGTAHVTVHTTQQLALSSQTIKVLGKEAHYGALGPLGSLAILTKELYVTLNITDRYSPVSFRRQTKRLGAQPTSLTAISLDDGEYLLSIVPYGQLYAYRLADCDPHCQIDEYEIKLGDKPEVEFDWTVRDVAATDTDHDGLTDLFVARAGGLTLHPALGAREFAEPKLYPTEFNLHQLHVADVNGDNFEDLIASAPDNGVYVVFIMNSLGEPEKSLTVPAQTGAHRIAIGDLDGDEDIDFVSLNPQGGFDIFTNNSEGAFTHSGKQLSAHNLSDIEIADIDGDLVEDIIVSVSQQNRILVLLREPDGGHRASIELPVQYHPTELVIGDFTGDGIPDIAGLSQKTSRIAVFAGLGGESFDSPAYFTTEIDCAEGELCSREPLYLVSGDFNTDHRLDLATVNPSTACLSRCSVNHATLVFQVDNRY
jgi:hypothetical protein